MKQKRCLSRDQERLRNYFGQPTSHTKHSQSSTLVVTKQFDNGLSYEIQMGRRVFVEYELGLTENERTEYIVPGGYTDYEVLESKIANQPGQSQGEEAKPFNYIEPFELDDRRQPSHHSNPCKCQDLPTLPQPPSQVEKRPLVADPPPVVLSPGVTSTPSIGTGASQEMPPAQSQSQSYFADASSDEFMADMQAILTGKKRFDPEEKKIQAQNPQPSLQTSTPEENQFTPLEAKNEHAIFDKIAQSMRFANAYDLGSMDLEKRFSAFDQASEIPKHKTKTTTELAFNSENTSAADFLKDLDEVRQANTRHAENGQMMSTIASTVVPFSLPNSPLVGTPWWDNNTAAKRFFTDEPPSNIDQFTIPPSVSSNDFYRDLRAAYPNHADTIIGDQAQTVLAQYFVIHDRGDGVHSEAPTSVADVNRSARGTHLYIGFQRILRVNDWHEAGDATGLERQSNRCFVHVELTQHRAGTAAVNENGTLVKAEGTRFTLWQYEMLAYAYLVASFRRGRFLTVTIHREVDRALDGGHGDPRDFDVNYFYHRVNTILGIGATSGFTFGIQQDRIMALRQMNMAGYVNEFSPFASGQTHAANQYGPPKRNPDGSWVPHSPPSTGPVCGNGNLFNQTT